MVVSERVSIAVSTVILVVAISGAVLVVSGTEQVFVIQGTPVSNAQKVLVTRKVSETYEETRKEAEVLIVPTLVPP